jgi:CxxC-x17-CxxC domain-containing protein
MAQKNEIAFFAKTNFRNQERVFGIKTDDRTRHMYIIGKTGMGKTNLLENLVVQDIRNGHGVCYIDPHGDTAEKLLRAVPANRINDVIYLNPADQNFPLAFNVMESVDPDYRHLVASGLIGVFKKIWADSWGPRLEYILRNAILALLEYPGSTLLGVTRILVDKKYRERVVERVTDPVIRQFWVDEFPKWSDKVLQEVVSPIQNKVGQFLSSSLIRNIVGQTQSSFDIRNAMDTQKILIINLSKGRIGEDNGALLGAMMITKIQLAAMGRVDIAEEDRKDFYLYVDEFQNFATESFANILSEARKYRLNLILANQYITQIDEKVRDAIFGNAGTIISFRVGAMDAEFLEKEFMPVFVQNDIVNLPKYNIYLKLMIDGIAGDAFSAQVLPPIYIGDTADNEEKIIAASRERYASSKEEVEDKISRWSGVMPANGFATVNKPVAANTNYAPSTSVPTRPVIQNPDNIHYAAPKIAPQNQPVQSRPVQPAPASNASISQPGKPKMTWQTPAPKQQPQVIQPSRPVVPAPQFKQANNNAVYTEPVTSPINIEQKAPESSKMAPEAWEPQKMIEPQVAVENAALYNADDLGEYNEPEAVDASEMPVIATQNTAQMQSQPVIPTALEEKSLSLEESIQAQIQSEPAVAVQAEENPDYYVKPIDDRPKYDAICDMCADAIQIPFQPDGKRPTFCKDCLKEYQRMTAKEKLNQERKIQMAQEDSLAQPSNAVAAMPTATKTVSRPPYQGKAPFKNHKISSSHHQGTGKSVQHLAYISKDRPMSLSQMQNIAPKKFKTERKKPEVNLEEVRQMLINHSRTS